MARMGPLGPGLHEYNLASHLVWWVAGVAWAVLAVVFAAEGWDWVRTRLMALRKGRSRDER